MYYLNEKKQCHDDVYLCKFEEKASKDDLMGVEDTAGRSMFHKTTLKHKGTVFSIDTRGEVLSSLLEAPIIVPHTASKMRVSTCINMCKYI